MNSTAAVARRPAAAVPEKQLPWARRVLDMLQNLFSRVAELEAEVKALRARVAELDGAQDTSSSQEPLR